MLNKNYLNWNLESRARYFRMFALHLRQDFKSLKYKQEISSLLSQYEFNLNNKQKTELRNQLRELNLYPTHQLLDLAKNEVNKTVTLSTKI